MVSPMVPVTFLFSIWLIAEPWLVFNLLMVDGIHRWLFVAGVSNRFANYSNDSKQFLLGFAQLAIAFRLLSCLDVNSAMQNAGQNGGKKGPRTMPSGSGNNIPQLKQRK